VIAIGNEFVTILYEKENFQGRKGLCEEPAALERQQSAAELLLLRKKVGLISALSRLGRCRPRRVAQSSELAVKLSFITRSES
jgi:hypothetical protein